MDSLGSLFSIEPPSEHRAKLREYAPDDIIGGRYLILKQHPSMPGHGNIFFCQDLWDKRPCVLKEIHASQHQSARLFATIPFHENVVQLWRLEVIGGSIMLVQEWLPDTLADHLEDERSGREIEEIILSLCRGLAHCIRHLSTEDAVFVHRDIKPENLFISTDGVIKLADFEYRYTPQYASLEVRKRERADQRADIYSIGKVLADLYPRCTDPHARAKLKSIADKCTEPSPEDRYQSVAELYKAISGTDMAYPDSGSLTPAQLCNLAKIGQPVNIYRLSGRLGTADSDELCDIAEVLSQVGLTQNAIETYNLALTRSPSARAFAGLAGAYSAVMDWDQALFSSSEAIRRNFTDHRSIYIHINALYNKADQEARQQSGGIPGNIGVRPDMPIIRTCFPVIANSLETLRCQFPGMTALPGLLGYIYAITGEDEKALRNYEVYLEKTKDDYQAAFLYAIRLYLSDGFSEAQKRFREIGDYIEHSESVSLVRGILLLQCRYYTDDTGGIDRALSYLDPILEQMSEAEKDNHADQLQKLDVIQASFEYDCDNCAPYFSALNQITRQIRSGWSDDADWCREKLRQMEQYREEWSGHPFSEISFAYKKLTIRSYEYDSFFHERLGDKVAALGAVEKVLEYDRSSADAHHNKAVLLIDLGRYIEAVPCCRRACALATDRDRRAQSRQMENELLAYLYDDPDSFYRMLLQKAASWQGSNPAELEAIIKDYRILFSDQLVLWLTDYTRTLLGTSGLLPQAFDPLLYLLETLHDTAIPEFSEEDLAEIVIPTGFGLSRVYRFRTPEELSAYTLPVLDLLVSAGEEPGIPDLLFNSLRLRGELYYDRKRGDRTENLHRALADFRRILELPECALPTALPHVAWASHYAGKCLIELGRTEAAQPYLDLAMSIYTTAGNRLNEGRVHLSRSISRFKERDYRNAALDASKSLECVTIHDDRTVFAKAKYILGLVSALLANPKRETIRHILDEGLAAFADTLLVFREGSAEWAVSMHMIGHLYAKKDAFFRNGSWALAAYYKGKAADSGQLCPDTRDFLGIRTSEYRT